MNIDNISLSRRSWLLIVLCILSIVLAGNRMFLQTSDTAYYVFSYDALNEYAFISDGFEPGYLLINIVLKHFQFDSFILLLTVASVGVGSKFMAIKRYSKFIFLSILVYYAKYYLLQDMVQIRAGIATGIFLLSIDELKSRNFKAYLLYVGIASLFHYSASVYLLLYFVCDERIDIVLFVKGCLCALVAIKIFQIDSLLFNYLSDYIPKLVTYTSIRDDGLESETKILSLELLMNTFVFSLFVYYREKFKTLELFDIWLKSLGVSILFSVAFANFPVLSLRLSELFGISLIFLLPHIISIFKSKYMGVAVFSGILLLLSNNYYFRQTLVS